MSAEVAAGVYFLERRALLAALRRLLRAAAAAPGGDKCQGVLGSQGILGSHERAASGDLMEWMSAEGRRQWESVQTLLSTLLTGVQHPSGSAASHQRRDS